MTGLAPAGTNYITPKNDHQGLLVRPMRDISSTNGPASSMGQLYLVLRHLVEARPHPKNAGICSSDGVGPVNNAAWADDLLFISVFLKTLNAGVNEFTVLLAAGGVGCTVTRNGANLIKFDFTVGVQYERLDWTCAGLREQKFRCLYHLVVIVKSV
ncbi:hypothetical protein FRC08_009900 [Ceratobasidium sp. 394]|nr:hypothetical protein FRC08_009900 [Ceratobasidium sp. 394]